MERNDQPKSHFLSLRRGLTALLPPIVEAAPTLPAQDHQSEMDRTVEEALPITVEAIAWGALESRRDGSYLGLHSWVY